MSHLKINDNEVAFHIMSVFCFAFSVSISYPFIKLQWAEASSLGAGIEEIDGSVKQKV